MSRIFDIWHALRNFTKHCLNNFCYKFHKIITQIRLPTTECCRPKRHHAPVPSYKLHVDLVGKISTPPPPPPPPPPPSNTRVQIYYTWSNTRVQIFVLVTALVCNSLSERKNVNSSISIFQLISPKTIWLRTDPTGKTGNLYWLEFWCATKGLYDRFYFWRTKNLNVFTLCFLFNFIRAIPFKNVGEGGGSRNQFKMCL